MSPSPSALVVKRIIVLSNRMPIIESNSSESAAVLLPGLIMVYMMSGCLPSLGYVAGPTGGKGEHEERAFAALGYEKDGWLSG